MWTNLDVGIAEMGGASVIMLLANSDTLQHVTGPVVRHAAVPPRPVERCTVEVRNPVHLWLCVGDARRQLPELFNHPRAISGEWKACDT